MAFTPLTEDQYSKAVQAGFTPEEIMQFEQKRKAGTGAPEPDKPSLFKQGMNLAFNTPQALTGKSIADRTMDASGIPIKPSLVRPYDKNVIAASSPLRKSSDVLNRTMGGMTGAIGDMAASPGNYIPIPGAKFLGKIPVGATNVGRVASNVGVGRGFIKGVQGMQDLDSALGNMATSASGKAIDTSSRGAVMKTYNKGVDKAILNVYNEAVNPNMGKYNSKSKLDSYQTKALDAMKDIHNNAGTVQFEDPQTGQVQSRTPKNRGELLDASSQRQGQIYDHYSKLAKQAGDDKENPVLIDRAAIAKKSFRDITRDPNYRTFDPKLVKQAKAIQNDLARQKPGTPAQVQSTMEYLNRKMKTYYNKEDYNAANVYANYAGNLRQALNKGIEDHMGNSGYTDLKKLYGSHAAIQKDLTKAAGRQLKNSNTDLGSHFSNPIALAEMARGVMTGNWAEFATGAAIKGQNILQKFVTNPDRRIAGMFNFMDKNTLKPEIKKPTLFKSDYKQQMQVQPKQRQSGQPIVNNMEGVNPNDVGRAVAQPAVAARPAVGPHTLGGPSEAMVNEGGPATNYSLQQAKRFLAGHQQPVLPIKNTSVDPNQFLTEAKRKMMGNSGQVGAHALPIAGAVGLGTAKAISSQKKASFDGQASTYGWGEKLNTRTFSGEKYDPNKVSVAMRNVPMGSTVKITDKKTGKTIEAVVNDGGPNIRTKRVADLSKGAWKALGYDRPGLTNVKVEVVKRGKGKTFTQKPVRDFSILEDKDQ